MNIVEELAKEIKQILERYKHKRIIESGPEIIIFETQDNDIVLFYPRKRLVVKMGTFLCCVTVYGGAGVEVSILPDIRGLSVQTDAVIQPTQMKGTAPTFRLINPTYIPPA